MLMAALLAVAAPAGAGDVIDVNRQRRAVKVSNLTSDDRVSVRCRIRLETGIVLRSATIEPLEAKRWRFPVRVRRVRCAVTNQEPVTPTFPGELRWDDGLLQVWVYTFFNGSNDQTNLYFYNETDATISYSCTWVGYLPNGSSGPQSYSNPALPATEYDTFASGGTSSISDLNCSSA
jgi:hypothetical protein